MILVGPHYEGKSRFDAVPFLDRSPTDTSTSRGKVLP